MRQQYVPQRQVINSSGVPSTRTPDTSRKFAKLIAARKTPFGAIVSITDWSAVTLVSHMLQIGCWNMAAIIWPLAVRELVVFPYHIFHPAYVGTVSETAPLCRWRQLNNIIRTQYWRDIWIGFQHNPAKHQYMMERCLYTELTGPICTTDLDTKRQLYPKWLSQLPNRVKQKYRLYLAVF